MDTAFGLRALSEAICGIELRFFACMSVAEFIPHGAFGTANVINNSQASYVWPSTYVRLMQRYVPVCYNEAPLPPTWMIPRMHAFCCHLKPEELYVVIKWWRWCSVGVHETFVRAGFALARVRSDGLGSSIFPPRLASPRLWAPLITLL